MLMYQHRIHSPYYTEHPWLTEGLASMLETGCDDTARSEERWLLRHFDRLGELPALESLLDHRGNTGLFDFERHETREVAYLQSASFVRFLLDSSHREGFVAFLRTMRNPARIDRLATARQSRVLQDHLGVDVDTLQAEWEAWAGLATR